MGSNFTEQKIASCFKSVITTLKPYAVLNPNLSLLALGLKFEILEALRVFFFDKGNTFPPDILIIIIYYIQAQEGLSY